MFLKLIELRPHFVPGLPRVGALAGPAFAGGLDCYSHPPDCAAQYRRVIGQGLLSRAGYAVVNDTNATRMSSAAAVRPSLSLSYRDHYMLPSLIELRLALFLYQDYIMLLLTLAGRRLGLAVVRRGLDARGTARGQ